ncbi:phosphatase PAP2 family protein [Streptomyces sp. NPDC058280]|uniref:phosphatase PAP2 family protein n=1 Tax=Streptomyces sp. NPDC058280 TaxID=3346419 RepID=UPI0036EC0ECA
MSHPAPAADRSRRTPALGVTALCAALFALLAVGVAARHGAPFPLDRSALTWSLGHRPAGALTPARVVTASGTGPYPYLCAIGAGLIAGHDLRHRLSAAAGALAFLVVGQAVRYAVLHAIGRPRPAMADWATHASGFAYPSGHATTSALVAGLLVWALARRSRTAATRALCALIVCWAVAVGLSRIYLGVHWVSDVLGGWLYAATLLGLGAVLIPTGRLLPHDVSGGRRGER